MIKIRPHHILCMKTFRGKGYNKAFIENMRILTNKLEYSEENIEVEIVFGLDNICSNCKCNTGFVCSDEEKVLNIDQKVILYFGLEEKKYNYLELKNKRNKILTKEIVKDICSNCEWFKNSNCEKYLLEI